MPMDLSTIDALLESDEVFFARYGFINDGGEFINPSPDYLHKERQRLIDHPEEYPFAVDYLIVVKEIKTAIGSIDYKYVPREGVTVFHLNVAPDDMGRVIGKHGRIAKAIRTVMRAAASRSGEKISVDID